MYRLYCTARSAYNGLHNAVSSRENCKLEKIDAEKCFQNRLDIFYDKNFEMAFSETSPLTFKVVLFIKNRELSNIFISLNSL